MAAIAASGLKIAYFTMARAEATSDPHQLRDSFSDTYGHGINGFFVANGTLGGVGYFVSAEMFAEWSSAWFFRRNDQLNITGA